MDITLNTLINNLTHVVTSGLNDWGSIHPLIVHFPIVLLFVAPCFILGGLIVQRSSKILYVCALILMLLGTSTVYLAASSGESAAEHVKADPAIVSTLDAHVQLAEQAELGFTVLSILFLLYCLLHSRLNRKFTRATNTAIVIVYLMAYFANVIILYNAAHYGAKLVHKHGVTSTLFLQQR